MYFEMKFIYHTGAQPKVGAFWRATEKIKKIFSKPKFFKLVGFTPKDYRFSIGFPRDLCGSPGGAYFGRVIMVWNLFCRWSLKLFYEAL